MPPLSGPEQEMLLSLAAAALSAAVRGRPLPAAPPALPPALSQKRGAFVTLTRRGRLRGCIGLIEASLPLAETVIRMAAAAALEDPRFPPVTAAELAELELEISVLSPLHRAASADEIELGRDGVLVRRGDRSGVFLPQVAAETGWDKERFLSELCAGKAGLAPDAWRLPGTELYTFTVDLLHGTPGAGPGGGTG